MFDVQESTSISLQEAKDNLRAGKYDFIWTSPGTRDRKRAAINKAEKIFRNINGIAGRQVVFCDRAEAEFFFQAYLLHVQYPFAGLKSLYHAKKWFKEFCIVCDVVTQDHDALAYLPLGEDDWAALLDYLTGQRESSISLGNYEMTPITSLARECRSRNITIAGLTGNVLLNFTPQLPVKTIPAVLTAVARLYELRGSNLIPSELLPPVAPEDIKSLVAPLVRVVPPINESFKSLIEEYISDTAKGRLVQSFGTEQRVVTSKELSADRILNIKDGLRWLWHGIVALEQGTHDLPFETAVLSAPTLLYDIVDACASGRLGPVCATQTRRDRCNVAKAFLLWHDPDLDADSFSILLKSTDLTRTTGDETDDKERKRRSCLNFINDEELQRRYFDMPRHFLDAAQPVIANFDEHFRPDGNGISKAQNRALELAVMAALTVINTRFPARLKTLNQLEICGKDCHALFPQQGKYSDCALLNIPGRIVKNGRYASGVPLLPGKRVDPRHILQWYINDVHPLLLKYKHKHAQLRRPDLLFAGLHIDTLRRYWRNHIVDVALDLTPHMCRHYSASLLLASGVPIEDIAELLLISVEMASGTYAFVARNLVIQNVMEAQAELYRRLDV
jgi:hypothetical protein